MLTAVKIAKPGEERVDAKLISGFTEIVWCNAKELIFVI